VKKASKLDVDLGVDLGHYGQSALFSPPVESPPPETDEHHACRIDGMRLIEVVATAQLLAALSPLMTASPSATETALEMVRAYVQEWRIALGAVIAEEHYTQKLEEWPQGRGTFSRRSTQTTRRLISEVLFVRASEHGDWLMFRDVLQVNGERVRDRTSRFDQLFISRPDDVIGGARRIADESARYNLGRLSRNINTPTTTLQFLDAAYSRSTTWTAPKSTKVDGTSAWELINPDVTKTQAARANAVSMRVNR
jgi:hypothetical protein